MKPPSSGNERSVVAGVLAWLVPGAGHYYLGLRGFARIYFFTITFVFVIGALIGGVKGNIDPKENRWLFLAESAIGSYSGVGFVMRAAIGDVPLDRLPQYTAYAPGADVAQVYLAIAGLMNVLAVLDAVSRAQNGLPLYYHELKATEPAAPTEPQP